MNEREKIENRRASISKEEKAYILSKTHRKCAKCGKTLSVESSDYTTDHFIPLNKAGSNDIENLVPLCCSCNRYKDDYVVSPDYYTYLDPHYKKEITKIYEDYCEKYTWTSFNNFAKEELIKIEYFLPIKSMLGHKKNGTPCGVLGEAYLFKAKEKDLDDICVLVREYNEKYGWPSDKAEVRSIVENVYNDGCMYMIKKKDELIGVIPIVIEPSERQLRQTYAFSLRGIPFKYQKRCYSDLFTHIFSYIFAELSSITDGLLLLDAAYPKADTFIDQIISEYIPCAKYEGKDSYGIKASLCFSSLNKTNRGDSAVKVKDVRYISETLQKSFNLPKLEFKIFDKDIEEEIEEKEVVNA